MPDSKNIRSFEYVWRLTASPAIYRDYLTRLDWPKSGTIGQVLISAAHDGHSKFS